MKRVVSAADAPGPTWSMGGVWALSHAVLGLNLDVSFMALEQ